MKYLPFLLAGTLLAGIAPTTVMADYESGMKSSAKMEDRMGKHDMTGTVEKIDHAKGMIQLKTDVGTLNLHFPPPSIKDLKMGDAITVSLSYSKTMMKKEMMK